MIQVFNQYHLRQDTSFPDFICEKENVLKLLHAQQLRLIRNMKQREFLIHYTKRLKVLLVEKIWFSIAFVNRGCLVILLMNLNRCRSVVLVLNENAFKTLLDFNHLFVWEIQPQLRVVVVEQIAAAFGLEV